MLKNKWTWVIVFIVLFFPAFFINLGKVGFIEDEGIRSLVALEMDILDNWITPTLNGEYYLKKPPLYNWILGLAFKMAGMVEEWVARIPTLFFLAAFTLTIFIGYKKYLSENEAFINAVVFMTCGRILFWDSMLALIDICFSWVIFTMFLWIFHWSRKQRYLLLFLGAYLLGATAFMLKAFPALVFLALTLLTAFFLEKRWRHFFSIWHVAGLLLFLGIVGIYLLLYNQYNPLADVVATYLEESTNRTIVKYTVLDVLKQLVIFPLEMLYHFLPWSLFLVVLLGKGVWQSMQVNPFIRYLLWVFIINIVVYWSSPQVYPRYLFMLAPLFFGLLLHLYLNVVTVRIKQFLEYLFLVLSSLVWIACWSPLFLERTQLVQNKEIKFVVLILMVSLLIFEMVKNPGYRIWAFAAFMLVLRIGFNWFILPVRAAETYGNKCRDDAVAIGKAYVDRPLFLYGQDTLRKDNVFYITAERNKILPIATELRSGDHLIFHPVKFPELLRFPVLDSMRTREDKYLRYITKIP